MNPDSPENGPRITVRELDEDLVESFPSQNGGRAAQPGDEIARPGAFDGRRAPPDGSLQQAAIFRTLTKEKQAHEHWVERRTLWLDVLRGAVGSGRELADAERMANDAVEIYAAKWQR